jgi:hypothetical protein
MATAPRRGGTPLGSASLAAPGGDRAAKDGDRPVRSGTRARPNGRAVRPCRRLLARHARAPARHSASLPRLSGPAPGRTGRGRHSAPPACSPGHTPSETRRGLRCASPRGDRDGPIPASARTYAGPDRPPISVGSPSGSAPLVRSRTYVCPHGVARSPSARAAGSRSGVCNRAGRDVPVRRTRHPPQHFPAH